MALELHHHGLRLVPRPGKRAIAKGWPVLHLDDHDIRAWSCQGVNWGVNHVRAARRAGH
jgi:hypothetical protein